ncbi:MAG: Adaptive-response sensory-kinase SasA [Syntrophus sp. SKADARSKE-3]|nr:Adaptive-response sensory-kinase SasA [Syntrophus sp. SKADARSKE-3]
MMAEPHRFLILEDNPADAELIQFELKEAGISFISKVVMHENDFVHEIQEFAPDLILSDYDLPKFNGASALAEANRRCPDTPFILVTGAIVEDRAIEILTQGAKDYVLKSRLEQRLIPAVKRALAEAEEHRARKKAEEELRKAHDELEARVRERTKQLETEIASRKDMEESLRLSDRRSRERAMELEALLNTAPIPIFITHDPDSIHITGNPAADKLLRNPPGGEASLDAPDDLKPRQFKAFKDGRELNNEELPAQRAAKGHQVQDFEFSLVFDDGTVRNVMANAAPLLDEKGRPRGSVLALTDVTERKRIGEELRTSEERMRHIAQAGHIGFVEWNTAKDTGYWSPEHYTIFGYEPGSQMSWDQWAQGVHPDDHERVLANAVRLLDRGRAEGKVREHRDEYRFIRPDGNVVWIESDISLDMVDSEPIIRGSIRDITERKRSEEALQTSEARYRELFNGMTEGFAIHEIITDNQNTPVDWRFLDINPAFERLTGMKREDVIGKTHNEVLPGDDPKWLSIYGTVALTGKPVQFENYSPALDRHYAVVAYSTVPRQFAVIFMDITERKRAEDALRKSEHRERERAEELEALLEAVPMPIIISHDPECSHIVGNQAANELLKLPNGGEISLTAPLERKPRHYKAVKEGRELRLNELPIRRAARGENVQGFEYSLVFDDGTTQDLVAYATPLRDDQGNPRGAIHALVDITERKKTEEALRENESLLQAFLEQSPLGLALLDNSGKIVKANKAYRRFVPETIPSCELSRQHRWKSWDEHGQLIRPSDYPGSRALRGENVLLGMELLFTDDYGKEIWTRVSAVPFRSQTGEVLGAVSVIQDIDQVKRAEEAMRESEEKFRAFADNTDIQIIMSSIPEGKVLYANQSFEVKYLYASGELVGSKMPDLYYDLEERKQVLHELRTKGFLESFEMKGKRKDGTWFWNSLTSRLIEFGGQKVAITAGVDITNRKLAEEALRTSEETFIKTFQVVAAAMALTRIEDRCIFDVNDRWLELMECSRDEVIGKTATEYYGWKNLEDRNEMVSELKTRGFVRDRECAILSRSGREWTALISAQFVVVRGEQIMVSSAIDITERKRAEEELKERTRQLEEANRELESVSYSVSHDLRAPLRAIDGYSRMILKESGERFDAETARKFQVIRDSSQKMGNLIDDILAFSRIGTQELKKSKFDIEGLVREVWEELIAAHPDRKLVLKNGGMLSAYGDQALIRQVYSNLLGNAVNFTHHKDAALIETGSCTRGNEAVYYVRDNGVGFNMQYYDKLFGVFQRLHADEEYKGTGIGLALVKRIIDRHGGRVWAEAEVDKGATFFFTLPTKHE